MANGHGGYREPRKPAAVSGPGKYSRRTDGGPGQTKARLTDAKYGEQKRFQEIQGGAPMGGQPVDTSAIVPLSAPSQRPDEPVTAGSALGPGPGPEVLGMGSPDAPAMDEQTKARVRAWMPALMWAASQPDASPETRQFVRQLRGDLL